MAVLRAGRPVLVVPEQLESLAAERILIAWKDTRESRRAVSDALPFLRLAKELMIVEVCEAGSQTQSQKNVDDVANYLQRHDIAVGIKAFLQTERTVADEPTTVARLLERRDRETFSGD